MGYLGTELSVTLTIKTSSEHPLRAAELGVQVVRRALAFGGARVRHWRGVEALTEDEADRRADEAAAAYV